MIPGIVAGGYSLPASAAPTVAGEAFGGGYYAGDILVGGIQYMLIVAPKASGEAYKRWRLTLDGTPIAMSVIDGRSNTAAMVAADPVDYEAAAWCDSLVIAGYADWHMPSRYECELMYRAFKPTSEQNSSINGSPNTYSVPAGDVYTSTSPSQTTAEQFKDGGVEEFIYAPNQEYWSSTNSDLDWLYDYSRIKGFGTGFDELRLKSSARPVRAVRWIKR